MNGIVRAARMSFVIRSATMICILRAGFGDLHVSGRMFGHTAYIMQNGLSRVLVETRMILSMILS